MGKHLQGCNCISRQLLQWNIFCLLIYAFSIQFKSYQQMFSMFATLCLSLLALQMTAQELGKTEILSIKSPAAFQNFQRQFRKNYGSRSEKFYRQAIYLSNVKSVMQHNSRNKPKYLKSLNQFSDLTPTEFAVKYGGLLPTNELIIKQINYKSEVAQIQRKACLCEGDSLRSSELKQNIRKNEAMLAEGLKKGKIKSQFSLNIDFASQLNKLSSNSQTIENIQSSDTTAYFINSASTFSISNANLSIQDFSTTSAIQSVSDWSNYTGPIIHQGTCGSCYAAATVQTVQALYSYYLFNGAYFKLSIQQIIDCANSGFNGCLGGWLQSSYQFIEDFGLTTHFKYPYNSGASGQSQACLYPNGQFIIQGYITIINSCTTIRSILSSRPVSVGISAAPLQLYSSGTFDDCIDSEVVIDHAVIIVSHSETKGWKIKNSWGTEWGEAGFAWITNDSQKNCGICRMAAAPFLSDQ